MYSKTGLTKQSETAEVKKLGLKYRSHALLIGALLALLAALPLSAQDTQNTKNTADQSLRSAGRVNPSTLGMEFDLPIGSYPGRGISMPLGISYSSKQWRFEEEETIHTPNNPKNVFAIAKFSDNAAAGWTSSLTQPYIEYTGEYNRFDMYGRPLPGEILGGGSTTPPGDYYIRRITVFLPGGESHELRASDAPVNNPNTGNAPPSSAWEGTFYSTDGSGLKYVQNSSASPDPIFRLYMPDGSYWDFNIDREDKSSTDFTQVRRGYKLWDVHGNYIFFNTPDPEGGTPYGSWTDQLDRTFPIMVPRETPSLPEKETTLTQSFHMPGLGNPYTLVWKPLLGESTSQEDSALTDVRRQALHYVGTQDAAQSPNYFTPSLFTSGSRIRACTNSNSYLYLAVPSPFEKFNPVVLTEIILPTGAKYRFTYNEYGEVERIYYPTGGREELDYESVPSLAHMAAPYQQSNRGVAERRIYESDSDSTADTWEFSAAASDNNYRTSVLAPDGTQTDTFMHRGLPTPSCAQEGYTGYAENHYGTRWGYDNIFSGKVYDERIFSSTGHIMKRTRTRYEAYTTSVVLRYFSTLYVQRNERPVTTESITYDGDAGLSAAVKTEYDTDVDDFGSPQNAIRTKGYAFTVVSGGNSLSPGETPSSSVVTLSDPTASATLVKSSETDYLNTSTDTGLATARANAAANNVLRLPIASRVLNASGTPVSQNLITYDTTGRGLPLANRAWDSTKGVITNSNNYITTSATYDTYGNKLTSTDANSNVTTINYEDTYHAFPETVDSPVPDTGGTYGASTALTTTSTYNCATGQMLSQIDPNGMETRFEYDSDNGRLAQIKMAYDTSMEALTQYYYGAADSDGRFSSGNRYIHVKSQIDSTRWSEVYGWFDGFGRNIKDQKIEPDGDVFTETEYDTLGRTKKASNPYRTGDTKKWTTPEYDDLSRTKKLTSPDSNEVNFTFGISTSGVIGLTKIATDQSGKKRKGISDAMGNMVRVIEDPDSQNLATDYVFDVLGNLRKTTQGDQVRYFNYNSLGRVMRVKQVEQTVNSSLALSAADPVTGNNSWTAGYQYDDNGNITSTTDAKNTSVSATYDALNRLTFRNYSDSTPDVTFYYDGKGLPSIPGNSKGQRTKVTSSVSENRYTSFDVMGRTLTSRQTTDGQNYDFIYAYNLAGALIEETYPSGRVVKNTIDEGGKLLQVQSKKNSSAGYWTYADAFAYNAAGAVTKMQLGNWNWENAAYNDRGQVTQIGLGRLSATQDFLKLEFKYNTGTNADNNGALREQKITVPTVGGNTGFTATQAYTYDSLNRLQSAAETISSSQTWKQTFSYDRYGNRRFNTSSGATTTLGSCDPIICNPTISASNNRINDMYYVYDANGNLLEDANAWKFAYDAENRQIEVKDDEDTVRGEYLYDGNAKRVKKLTEAETTIFVYDITGALAAEYSTAVSSPHVRYTTADNLGSPRVVTDESGAVVSRKDFSPFGEEIFSSQRTSAHHYTTASGIRPDYTGYQKDAESSLEYAQARYFDAKHGRFTSVDPLPASSSLRNPQTFNRYAYGLNSPYQFTDPAGLLSVNSAACGQFCKNNQFMNDVEVNGALSAAAASGISWSLDTWDAYATTYVLNQPDGSKVLNDIVFPASFFSANGSSETSNSLFNYGTIIAGYGEPGTVHNVGQNFKRAAETFKAMWTGVFDVLIFPIKSIEGFQGLIDMAKKMEAGSIALFTHGDWDSIYLGDGAPNESNTITLTNVNKLINTTGGSLAAVHVYACNTGAVSYGIAAKLSKQLGVQVNAPSGGLIFSTIPSKPDGNLVHPNSGPTFMVNNGGSWAHFKP